MATKPYLSGKRTYNTLAIVNSGKLWLLNKIRDVLKRNPVLKLDDSLILFWLLYTVGAL